MIEVYTDGATNEKLQRSGIGIYIKTANEKYEYSMPVETLSNHEAEFMAVEKALSICLTQFPNEILSFRTDSQIVVDTIDKNYTKNKLFQPYLQKITQQIEQFQLFFIKWIPSHENKHADQLARKACHIPIPNL